ncbi:Aste57867_17624 [Aphanomyces stellatus]|uniref:Aste57867_17624 protein n=1 Tax=Aphanomyces stellatus TaxID=120398 RepID=A0A485L879_9STRA|nr:hypothetical protein As57867_017564 [Aphanomyces stellatus]VFT94375.1 Aste57867_17624 [Aphanomyces stellatus]
MLAHSFAWTLVGAALSLANSPNVTTLWGGCPGIIMQPTDMSFCIQNEVGALSTVPRMGPAIDLSARGIQMVQSLPSEPTSLDLSKNAIRDIPTFDRTNPSTLQTLNLSWNAMTQDSRLELPSTLKTLDLSYNRISKLFRWAPLSTMPSLTRLILKGNQLSMIRETSFPPTLKELDVTNNPIVSFDMNPATYRLLTQPDFVLKMDKLPADVVTSCVGTPTLLPGTSTYVCVYDGAHDEISAMAFAFLSKYAAVVMCVFVLAFVIRRYRQSRNQDQELYPRDTYLSSNCNQFDDVPVQYRESVTGQEPVIATEDVTRRHV